MGCPHRYSCSQCPEKGPCVLSPYYEKEPKNGLDWSYQAIEDEY